MADCVAIAPELPFRQQVSEFATHLTRSLPSSTEASASKDFIASFEDQISGDEVSDAQKQAVVKGLIGKLSELRGGLEAAKESEPESAHMLLLHLLSATFTGSEFDALYRNIIETVQKGGEANASAGRYTRVEAACRILNNAYNYLPSSSPLRPTTLLSLLALLAKLGDVSSLPLSPSYLSQQLSAWSLSPPESVSFLVRASEIYQSAQNLSKAVELLVLALQIQATPEIVSKAITLSLAREDSFDLDQVMSVQGVAGGLEGQLKELVQLFTETDELEAVKKGESWVSSNGDFVKNLGVPQLSTETIQHKLRLIALVTLAARSESKQLSYNDVASALHVSVEEVEIWVIDAIRANLLNARLSQPTSTIRIQSVSKAGTRRFGSTEWQLLEKRLVEWQNAVNDAKKAIEAATEFSNQVPTTYQRRDRQQGGGNQRRGGQRQSEQGQGQQQQGAPVEDAREEIAA